MAKRRTLLVGVATALVVGLGWTSSQADPPIHLTSSELPTVQVGESWVRIERATVEVPVIVKEEPLADGLFLTVEFDPSVLGYGWYQEVDSGWTVKRVTPYGAQRVAFLMRRTGSRPPTAPAAEPWQGTVLKVMFILKSSQNQAFRVSTPVTPGVETTAGEPGDSFFFSDTADSLFHAFPTSLRPGSVTIYYGDGLEIGSGSVTQAAQEFHLPLYLTSRDQEKRLFLVGVDYDELFLNISGVRGAGPMSSDEFAESLRTPGPGRMEFQVTLPEDFKGDICHLHVADLQISYTGEVPDKESLPIQPSLLLAKDDNGQGGGGGTYGGSVAGEIEFLPAHFVRGNVDSSVSQGREGSLTYAADVADARLILEAIFLGTHELECHDAADVNDTGDVDLSDVIWLLNHLFRSGEQPPAPYPYPGADPSYNDELDCGKPLPVFVPTGP